MSYLHRAHQDLLPEEIRVPGSHYFQPLVLVATDWPQVTEQRGKQSGPELLLIEPTGVALLLQAGQ